MKQLSLFAISTVVILSAHLPYANASAAQYNHAYSNSVSAQNIVAIQHAIMSNAMQTFEGTAAAALGTRTDINEYMPNKKATPITPSARNMYGTMRKYGEYNDDGTATQGRSGGNEYFTPIINSVWATWQHYNDDLKFNNYDKLNTDYDLIMLGLSGGRTQIAGGISDWGIYGGYVGGNMENKFINMDENGGYFGIYGGYNIGSLNISASANMGAIYNQSENIYGTDEYANLWSGVAVNATYNIALDKTFTLQPAIYAGYTWVQSANYISASGDAISNDNLNAFEITPALRAIKHIGKGWFGFANVKYVMMFGNGADTFVDSVALSELETDNYFEYGLGIEKSIDRFNISININRHDGGRDGWNGGFNFKYLF